LRKKQQAPVNTNTNSSNALAQNGSIPAVGVVSSQTSYCTNSIETKPFEELTATAQPTIQTVNSETNKESIQNEFDELSQNLHAGTSCEKSEGIKKEDEKDSKKKKNRCGMCRKKVGLTGFECRCGGLFCAIHRYSDKHECSFDYREHGAAEIRRNNPVVVGEKIQKI